VRGEDRIALEGPKKIERPSDGGSHGAEANVVVSPPILQQTHVSSKLPGELGRTEHTEARRGELEGEGEPLEHLDEHPERGIGLGIHADADGERPVA
jgi:hypothetical protein